MKFPVDINNYWGDRKDHDLYRLTVALANAVFRDAESAIDVGCYTSGLICELDWIRTRVASDIKPYLQNNWTGVEGVEFVAGDAFALEFGRQFDLVISNQTVEHLDDPKGFIEKLLKLGRGLIVSTTYEVPYGTIEGHVQDPISLEKFTSWFPCPLDSWFVCHHPKSRTLKHIVGVVKQSHPSRRTK
jgi:SAM-dependent methyltransferase